MEQIEASVTTEYPARVRYRAGVVGERRRVVHVAMSLRGGDFLALCELRLAAGEVEEISDLRGMPCMVCTRVLAMRSRAPEVVAGQGNSAIPAAREADGAGIVIEEACARESG